MGVDAGPQGVPWGRVHFVGVGGAGMCALAEVLLADGHAVSGSDLVASAATRRLAKLGAEVRLRHADAAVENADAVVVSTAIGDANPELRRARQLRLPVLARGELLARLMRSGRGIAVAGSHGKTTTAALIASVLRAGGLDPSFAIGGAVNATGGNGHRGAGRRFVVEADESDASFLRLCPDIAVVTNVDHDHLDTYGQDFHRLRGAFGKFLGALAADGAAVLCADDAQAALLAHGVGGRVLTYGFAPNADVRAVRAPRDVRAARAPRKAASGPEMSIARPDASTLAVVPPLPGCHNARNVLAAVAVATLEGVADDAITQGIENFAGVRRRFEIAERTLAGKRYTLVDDYGHHPTEIAGVIGTVRRRWRGRRVVMVYQPHRYTRLRDLCDDFARELAAVDALLLVDVYAAGEAAIAGVDSELLGRAIARRGAPAPPICATPEAACDRLARILRDGDVIVAQGAGDIDRLPHLLESAA